MVMRNTFSITRYLGCSENKNAKSGSQSGKRVWIVLQCQQSRSLWTDSSKLLEKSAKPGGCNGGAQRAPLPREPQASENFRLNVVQAHLALSAKSICQCRGGAEVSSLTASHDALVVSIGQSAAHSNIRVCGLACTYRAQLARSGR